MIYLISNKCLFKCKISCAVQIKSNKDNAIISELLVVIYGDVNGDGQINAKDMLYLQQHLLGIITLTFRI